MKPFTFNTLAKHIFTTAALTLLIMGSGCGGCGDTPVGQNNSNNTPSNNTTPTNSTTPGNNTTNVCRDLDGDGAKFGPNCAEATDCDDQDGNVNPSAAEVCGDGRDNNCNGVVDEECPCQTGELRLCSSSGDPTALDSSMRCKPGIQRCQKGAWSTECEGEVGPAEETCNNLDDDCDGTIDEDLRTPLGLCKDDLPPDYMPPPEDCGPTAEGDGLDNDGDGDIDEGCSCALPDGAPDSATGRQDQPCYGGPLSTLGVGECKGGLRSCNGGLWGSCTDQVTPVPEVCGDGLDNNCNGLVDDGCPSCTPSGDEVCDGIDNNCNGIIDEGVRNACGGCGMAEAQETCGDGFDNDCNGLVDEGCPCSAAQQECYSGPQEAAGKGICAMGTQSCSGEEFGTCEGSILPQIEQCGPDGTGNGLDDDCDGEVDEGCGCTEGATRPCGTSAGVCEYGMETCSAGVWGACAGGTPATESPESSCDGLDNDCDGLTDEGLLNACGKCNEACYTQGIDPVTVGMADDGVDTIDANDPDNPRDKPGITLGKETTFPSFIWAADTNTEQVSKIDTNTNEEVGRYWVGISPSRTAVDLDGNMWVIGRNDGRVTKILWDTTRCPDRNGNGTIDTSANVAGTVSVLNNAANPLADECVVFSEVINPNHPSGRGIAVTPSGTVWFGFSDPGAGGIQAVDPNNPMSNTPNYPPTNIPLYTRDANGVHTDSGMTGNLGRIYGLISDSQGNVWAASLWDGVGIAKFDTTTLQWTEMYQFPDCGPYGIALDGSDRVWIGCWGPAKALTAVLDPASKESTIFYMPAAQYNAGAPPANGASFAATLDGAAGATVRTSALGVEPATGDIWITHNDNSGLISRLSYDANNPSASTIQIIRALIDDTGANIPEATGRDMRGIGFDSQGFAWHLGMSSEFAIKFDPDPTNPRRLLTVPMPGAGGHYTYSDFSGSSLFNFTAPRGIWRTIFDTQFSNSIVSTVEIEAHVPTETTLGMRVRVLDANGNPVGDWIPVQGAMGATYAEYPVGAQSHTFDLSTIGGPLVGSRFEVEVRFTTTDRDIRPIVYDLSIGWQRP